VVERSAAQVEVPAAQGCRMARCSLPGPPSDAGWVAIPFMQVFWLAAGPLAGLERASE
jgi:hypothetical protein